MKLKFSAIVTLLFIGFAATAQDYVTFYADCNFSGTAFKMYPGRQSLSGTSVGTYNVSSIKIPPGFKVIVYTGNQPGTGNKTSYTYNVTCLAGDWNDKIVSVVVEGNSNKPYNNNQGYNNNNNNNYNRGGGISLYEDCEFAGYSTTLGEGSYSKDQMGVGNDKISSIKVPFGWTITVFQDDYYSGGSTTYNTNMNCLPKSWNDKISSFRISRQSGNYNIFNRGNNNAGYSEKVALFDDCNYQGFSSTLDPGSYNMSRMGIGGGRISAIKVPSGWSITVYERDNFGGRSATYYSSIECLSRDWNDKISSVRISSNGNRNTWQSNNGNVGDYHSELFPAMVYLDANFGGRVKLLTSGNSNLQNGQFDYRISSIKLSTGFRATLFSGPSETGDSYEISSSVSDLNSIGWNDRIRSIRIYHGNY